VEKANDYHKNGSIESKAETILTGLREITIFYPFPLSIC
ncbi:MAG: hypothetical protein FD167_1888, partial [bacterium]